MVRHRPASVLVIAILNLIGGVFGLLGGCVALVGMSASTAVSPAGPTPPPPRSPGAGGAPVVPDSAQMTRYMEDHVPGYLAFTYSSLTVSLILDVMLLASGVGLILMQPWARMTALVYAPLSILFHIISLVYQVLFTIPAMNEMFSASSALAPMSSFMQLITYVSVVFGFLIIIYPIVVLSILLRRSTAAAFRNELPSLANLDDIDEDHWERPSTGPSDAITR